MAPRRPINVEPLAFDDLRRAAANSELISPPSARQIKPPAALSGDYRRYSLPYAAPAECLAALARRQKFLTMRRRQDAGRLRRSLRGLWFEGRSPNDWDIAGALAPGRSLRPTPPRRWFQAASLFRQDGALVVGASILCSAEFSVPIAAALCRSATLCSTGWPRGLARARMMGRAALNEKRQPPHEASRRKSTLPFMAK